jgi:hypothetical protein
MLDFQAARKNLEKAIGCAMGNPYRHGLVFSIHFKLEIVTRYSGGRFLLKDPRAIAFAARA